MYGFSNLAPKQDQRTSYNLDQTWRREAQKLNRSIHCGEVSLFVLSAVRGSVWTPSLSLSLSLSQGTKRLLLPVLLGVQAHLRIFRTALTVSSFARPGVIKSIPRAHLGVLVLLAPPPPKKKNEEAVVLFASL